YDGPIVCRQCENAPCAQSCPVEAIERKGWVWAVNYQKCIGCGVCVQECPFGAIWLHPEKRTAIKCDQCGNCVRHCPTGKLKLADPNEIAYEIGMKHSKRLKEIMEEINGL
ncbi:MAG: 4Fe-4S binding protein, partial [Candidatus Hadarchaeum sp.]|uniref:4Fe-4S binding protein n=1 Tax=Candidatus Hadarchaeum sp. TaxID=2883567 RepID=UPI003D0FEDF1